MAVTAKSIRTLLTASPFKPFTITTARTGSYPISQPSNVFLTQSAVYIGQDMDADGIPGSVQQVPLAQISKVE